MSVHGGQDDNAEERDGGRRECCEVSYGAFRSTLLFVDVSLFLRNLKVPSV
jgi:hypothetical protein